MVESKIVFAVEESPEGGYEAHALGHSIFTEADSLPELHTMIRDAIRCHFDGPASPEASLVRRFLPDAGLDGSSRGN